MRMTNVAKVQTAMLLGQHEPEINSSTLIKETETKKSKRKGALTNEDQQVVIALNKLKHELEDLHNRYDQTTDPLLVDSLIYELKAVNIRYIYFLHLCKEKGIVGGGPVWTEQP